ncbi:MAG: hypothetical protein H0W72_13175 [Planctomycetes bacterium]|nr:hypothetical protein [Planctomycetota bacterium]
MPDPFGLGERLALIDWLRDHQVTVDPGARDPELRALYEAEVSRLAKVAADAARAAPAIADGAEDTVPGIAAFAPRTFLDQRLTLQVPEDFLAASPEQKLGRFAEPIPSIVLCDPQGALFLAVDHTRTALAPQQLAHAHRNVEIALRARHPEATWLRNELVEIGGRPCFIVDLRSGRDDAQVRSLTVGTGIERRLLLVTCTLAREHEERWLPNAQRIVRSLDVAAPE